MLANKIERLEPLVSGSSPTGLTGIISLGLCAAAIGLALSIGICIRTIGLESVPPGLNQDEACNAYDAYCLLRTGRDQHGVRWPTLIRGFNDYRMPLFDYCAIPWIGALGLRPGAIRMAAATWGCLDLFAVTGLALMLIGARGAALAALLLALSPWHLPFSRFGIEATAASASISLALIATLAALRAGRGIWLIASAVPWAMALYAYSITKAFIPPMLLLVAVTYRGQLRRRFWWGISGVGLLAVLAVPQAVAVLRDQQHTLARLRTISAIAGFTWLQTPRPIAAGMLSYLDPRFLFTRGCPSIMLHPPGIGQLLVAQAPMLVMAVIGLGLATYRKVGLFLWLWLVVALIPAALVRPSPHPLHAILAVAPLTLLSALGMVVLVDWAWATRAVRLGLSALFLAGVLIQGAWFVRFYFHRYPVLAASSFQYGVDRALRLAVKFAPPEGPIVVTDSINQPYIYVLFYDRFSPQRLQAMDWTWSGDLFAPVRSLDRYLFSNPAMVFTTAPAGVFIFPGAANPPVKPIATVKYPSGSNAYMIVVKTAHPG